MIDRTLGAKGKVVAASIRSACPRAEAIHDGGMEVPAADGIGDGDQLPADRRRQGRDHRRLRADRREVNPVLRALRENGIEVTALHNHMLDDQPRLFFMHFWANDDAAKLAKGLRDALDKTARAKS